MKSIKIRLATIAVITIISISLFCQGTNSIQKNGYPTGSEWYYSFNNFWITGYVKIEYSGDTLLSGDVYPKQYHNCQILKKTFFSYNLLEEEFDTINLGVEFTYTNKDTVFLFKHNQFYVLYNFSAQPGDSWIIPGIYETTCDSVGLIKVVLSGDTIIQSEKLRYITVEPNDTSQWIIKGLIIEKIGPVDWYMFPEQNCMTDMMEGGPLRCYTNDNFQFSTGIAPYCDYILSINENDSHYFRVYPNPVFDDITIDCPSNKSYDMEIRSIYGSNLHRFTGIRSGMHINVKGMLPGTYILTLTDKQSNIFKTKLQILKTK